VRGLREETHGKWRAKVRSSKSIKDKHENNNKINIRSTRTSNNNRHC
jgi:hypothetical protein